MRFLFTPLGAPTLSAAGARAGLGPDGAARDGPGAADVDTRPDPRLDRPIASRLADDISEAAQMAQAERMGVHVPVEVPVLSAAGKMAGLGAFGASSSSPSALRNASMNELALSRSKVSAAGRKAMAMQSQPVAPISDAGARRGITGKGVIRAAGAGFEMRVPKEPVAQDRERWKSGTEDRIAAASKGLGLAEMTWGDHRGAPTKASKSEPKRTWVGKQGDATECPDGYHDACAVLAVAPHAAVNKTAPLRELAKETVPSDVCPPIKSSSEVELEAILRCNADFVRTSPIQFLRILEKHYSQKGRTLQPGPFLLKLPAGSKKEPGAASRNGSNCGCVDCGCKDSRTSATNGFTMNRSSSSLTPDRPNGAPIHASTPALLARSATGGIRTNLLGSDTMRRPDAARLTRRRKNRDSVRARSATALPAVPTQPSAPKRCAGMNGTAARRQNGSGARELLSGPPGSPPSATTLAFLARLQRAQSTSAPRKSEARASFFARRIYGMT